MKRTSKLALIGVWSIFIAFTLEAQQIKPTLTILPFTGAVGEDEEIITLLFANQEDIRTAFTVIPCSTNFQRISEETVGLSSAQDHEALIGEIQQELNADFTLMVRAEKVGTTHLALISLVELKTLRFLGGEYRQYRSLSEFRYSVPDIAANLIQAAQRRDEEVPKLTVFPFYIHGVPSWEADILVQLLTIELANSRKYAILPWDLSIETMIRDFSIPYSGIIDPDRIKTIGIITNIPYVLAGDVLNLGSTKLFIASIVDTEDGNLVSGGDIEYRAINEDLSPLMAELLTSLSGEALQITDLPEITEPIRTETAPAEAATAPEERVVPFEQGVRIPEGVVLLGSPLSEVARDRDEVQHRVRVLSFYIGKYEVSQQEYSAMMGTNPSYFRGDRFPVERVTWFDAVRYCNTRSIKEGLTPAYAIDNDEVTWDQKANGYRLPTEAEWEYACRAGTTTAFNVGDTINTNQSNYDGTYTYPGSSRGVYRHQTTAIGSFPPNPWGLYDMHGNVYEWCWDEYGAYESTDWVPNRRIVRGGSWYSAPQYLRSANRVRMAPSTKTTYLGFRVVRNAESGE
ncbi:MAG: formylglycine-generating enzyme family protein [Treponema sp.]|jgi:formylglycine-generating enzyme required for sulfatase activity|nr:formylglycine-generating enzyme family protein [Treponema sp.]